MLANSGLEAKAVRLSTASIRGPVAARQFSRFSWLKAPSRACGGTERAESEGCHVMCGCVVVAKRTPTLMDLTRLAVVLATSLADWTNCRFATGLAVLEDARRQALHSADVCLATMVAAERT